MKKFFYCTLIAIGLIGCSSIGDDLPTPEDLSSELQLIITSQGDGDNETFRLVSVTEITGKQVVDHYFDQTPENIDEKMQLSVPIAAESDKISVVVHHKSKLCFTIWHNGHLVKEKFLTARSFEERTSEISLNIKK